ncbi:haloacid dehalogenase type II [Vibrio sp. WXL210]|uniref:haloacid dehalogenase type II n=1 Tax=Vibrio sp. WXL210 TaxID=3450709 RepID=UPI003EC70997
MPTYAFDVYGTLIDTHGVVTQLHQLIGEQAQAFSHTWRNKQLEYAFRRALMQDYVPFSTCTADALEYACLVHQAPLQEATKQQLLQHYLTLPAFADVESSLLQLKQQGNNLVAFSNGELVALQSLLANANLLGLFDSVISCEAIRTFKPNPAVYTYLVEQTGDPDTQLISSNAFDIIGAHHFGLKTHWLQRDPSNLWDPWGEDPTNIIHSLADLSGDAI